MNFFAHQEKAKFNTKKLVFMFIMAILSIIFIVNLCIAFYYYIPNINHAQSGYNIFLDFLSSINRELFLYSSISIILVIALVSFIKKMTLSSGGKDVAISLGGKLISPDSRDFKERQLLNIVEEMAIASGISVPPIYVIEEESINAFAAGYNFSDAVIGVTKGTINYLNRDELQAIIAHEFSHIFNGDMKINIKLISILHGILFFTILGRIIIHSSFYSRRSRSKESSGAIAAGVVMLIVGYLGYFFGKLIKSSISRQREYLADASAVQFTRNKDGIASALKKIGTLSHGSTIKNPKANEVSHMFFGESSHSLISMMSTHPPLEKRILAVDPNWDGEFNSNLEENNSQKIESQSNTSRGKKEDIKRSSMATLLNNIGNIEEEKIEKAHNLILHIPEEIKEAAHESFGSRAIIYCLLIQNDEYYEKQLKILEDKADNVVFKLVQRLHPIMMSMDNSFRLSLIEMSAPSLKQLSKSQYNIFKNNVLALIESDEEVSLFEWSLAKIIFHNLDVEFNSKIVNKSEKYSLLSIKDEVSTLLSIISHNDRVHDSRKCFELMVSKNNISKFNFLEKKDIKISDLDKAMNKLERLKVLDKEKLLKMISNYIDHDMNSFRNLELIRAIGVVLDCTNTLI
jgi:Zn-dependent protease with chaperone function